MAVKPLFTIEPFRLPAPAQRSVPVGHMPQTPVLAGRGSGSGGGGFAGTLGQMGGPNPNSDKIAAVSELMLGQGLMEIMAEGGEGEGGGAGGMGGLNGLLLASMLGGNTPLAGNALLGAGGNSQGLPAQLGELLKDFPGGMEGLVKALRTVAETQAGAAESGATAAPPPAPTLPATVAAHPGEAAPDPADPADSVDSAAPAGGQAPGLARSTGLRAYSRALPKGQAAASGAPNAPNAPGTAADKPAALAKPTLFSHLLGRLSARFESGGDPGSVGWDRVGGTSYGMYQLSSKAGTMDQFIGFLQARRPELAAALEAAGRADTGSTSGAMPATWRALAAQDPDGFARLQHDFISQSHFLPAAERIKDATGLDLAGNPALAEVLFSTAVQHGANGAANLIADAVEAVGGTGGPGFAAKLVGEIYQRRAGRFTSSDAPVREAVRSRLKEEREQALSLLRAGGLLDSNV